jgi:hypothetical protein
VLSAYSGPRCRARVCTASEGGRGRRRVGVAPAWVDACREGRRAYGGGAGGATDLSRGGPVWGGRAGPRPLPRPTHARVGAGGGRARPGPGGGRRCSVCRLCAGLTYQRRGLVVGPGAMRAAGAPGWRIGSDGGCLFDCSRLRAASRGAGQGGQGGAAGSGDRAMRRAWRKGGGLPPWVGAAARRPWGPVRAWRLPAWWGLRRVTKQLKRGAPGPLVPRVQGVARVRTRARAAGHGRGAEATRGRGQYRGGGGRLIQVPGGVSQRGFQEGGAIKHEMGKRSSLTGGGVHRKGTGGRRGQPGGQGKKTRGTRVRGRGGARVRAPGPAGRPSAAHGLLRSRGRRAGVPDGRGRQTPQKVWLVQGSHVGRAWWGGGAAGRNGGAKARGTGRGGATGGGGPRRQTASRPQDAPTRKNLGL